jgi:protein TonB
VTAVAHRLVRGGTPLGAGVIASVAVHAAALVVLLVSRDGAPPALPPVYAVELVAAPPGPRATGAVGPPPTPSEAPPTAPTTAAPAPTTTAPAPTAKRPAPVPKDAPKAATATKASPRAVTPSPTPAPATKAPAAAAGAGPTGGTGTDVASVKTEGIAFPYPGYLQNIVRQIALRFKPKASAQALRADVAFLIHRDGSVTGIRFVTRSGSYAFDLEAQGAVEAAASAGAFGPLPTGFPDDVLPVTFSFDPKVLP